MEKSNTMLRELAEAEGVKFWQIADYIGKSQSTFTVWMRHERPETMREELIAAFKAIAEGRDNG